MSEVRVEVTCGVTTPAEARIRLKAIQMGAEYYADDPGGDPYGEVSLEEMLYLHRLAAGKESACGGGAAGI